MVSATSVDTELIVALEQATELNGERRTRRNVCKI
jgi:hypothetical protein